VAKAAADENIWLQFLFSNLNSSFWILKTMCYVPYKKNAKQIQGHF
jgi:hypothetical protein